MDTPPVGTVKEIVGVYDADSSLMGEFSYWVGSRLGRRHCGLCAITHGAFGPRRGWAQCATRLPAPFVTYHRDDVPVDVRALNLRQLPVVIFRMDNGVRVAMDQSAIDACGGSANELMNTLLSRLARPEDYWLL
jgi:hypothetical protein